MNCSTMGGLAPVILLAGMLALQAGCGSTPTAAPVIEHSPNAGPAPTAKPTPSPTTAVTMPQPAAPQATSPATAPAAAPAANPERQPLPAEQEPSAVAEEPTTKPYREGDWRPEYYTVKKGDTLYSIALDYGQDYRELAAWNNLADPSLIKIDQRLRLFPPGSVGEAGNAAPTPLAAQAIVATPVFSEPMARKLPYSQEALAQLRKPAANPGPVIPSPGGAKAQASTKSPAVRAAAMPSPSPGLAPKEMPASDAKMTWEWPAQGKLSYGFGQGSNQKGIGIEGRIGQAVLAAAPGKVVYSGNGLRGYGKLIIIKHNATYLSVYAHNSQILVKEGQTVAKGQKIGEIGATDSDRVGLHFEIRRLGKPIDPLLYLPARAT